ncbi:hypothetical protein ACSSS7_006740 [Eimeria intestinalis]
MVLLGVCNPLLDVVAEVPASVLDEYGLPHGGAVLADEKQMTLFPRLEEAYSCEYMAGGCGQNTLRVYQALSKKASAGATKFIGCIGKDKEGKQLKELLQKQGVRPIYKVLLKLARYCQQTGKLFACNLSAEFLMHQFKSEYKEMLRMANITCGNKEEAMKYAEINGFGVLGSTGDIASQILDCMLEGLDDGPSKMKMVVITQGSSPVIVASRT